MRQARRSKRNTNEEHEFGITRLTEHVKVEDRRQPGRITRGLRTQRLVSLDLLGCKTIRLAARLKSRARTHLRWKRMRDYFYCLPIPRGKTGIAHFSRSNAATLSGGESFGSSQHDSPCANKSAPPIECRASRQSSQGPRPGPMLDTTFSNTGFASLNIVGEHLKVTLNW